MGYDREKWLHLAAKLRRALGLTPPTPAEADAEMAGAEEAPMSDEAIERIVKRVCGARRR